MTPGLLDTDILIAYRETDDAAVAFVQRVRETENPQVSQASVLALLAWCPDADDRIRVDAFLSPVKIHTLSASVSHKAVSLMRGLPAPSRITPIDGLVAATAVLLKLPLYALAPERYAGVPGLTVFPAR
ncbi:MAG TPA: PIN domain-containing protein [Urbifossiella sp.]|nr:PIN domain-containing protein [Urbifossiella sp.]